MDLKNKGVLVTGGASGLGAACVRLLSQAGAKVVIADLNSELGNALAGELGDSVIFVKTDVVDEASVQGAIDAALSTSGNLSVVINCAGIGVAEKVLGKNGPSRLASFNTVIQVNLVGTFNVIRLAAAAMAENEPDAEGERGVIFNTPLLAGLPEPARISLGQQVPFPPRLGRPAEYAALAKHIIENPMLNGEVIRLDGAIRMQPR